MNRFCLPALFSVSLIFLSYFSPHCRAEEVQVFTNVGLYGGMVEDIVFNPDDPDQIFAATYTGGGLFSSSNGGEKWSAISINNDAGPADTFKNNAVFDIAMAPSDSNVVYVVHNDWADISSDGGKTWKNVLNSAMQKDCTNCGEEPDDFRLCQTVAVDPANSSIAYVGSVGPNDTYLNGAVYKTTDMGDSWEKMNQGTDFDFAIKKIAVDPQNSQIIWLVTSSEGKNNVYGGSLYRSEDGGDTWENIFSLTPYNGSFFTVAVKPDDSNTVFTGSGYGVYSHVFDGETWISASAEKTSALAYDIVFYPQDPDVMYASWLYPTYWGGDGIGKTGRSVDGGKTWTALPHGYEFNTLAVHPTNSEILLAGDFQYGLFKSVDHGQNWTPYMEGIEAVIVYDVAVDPNDNKHLVAGMVNGLYEKTESTDWTRILQASIRSVEFHPADSQTIYAGTRNSGLRKTTDGGLTWVSTAIDGYYEIPSIAIDRANPDTLFIAVLGLNNYGEIYKSGDAGATLEKVLDGVNLDGDKYPFNVVAIDPTDSNHVFAGGGRYFTPEILGDLWESKDGGASWERNSLRDESYEESQGIIVNAILIHPDDPNLIYVGAGFSAGSKHPLYISKDSGKTWSAAHEGFPIASSNSVVDLALSASSNNIVYAATKGRGIFATSNQGGLWLNLGKPEYDLRTIAAGSVYGASDGGLFQLTGTGLVFGDVRDEETQQMITGASVFTDQGSQSVSINGEYMIVTPAGIFDVSAAANSYSRSTASDVAVYGGEATQADFELAAGNNSISAAELIYPDEGAIIDGTSIEVKWKGQNPSLGAKHYLYYSADPNFSAETPLSIASLAGVAVNYTGAGFVLILLGASFIGGRKNKTRLLLATAFLCACFMSASCGKNDSDNDAANTLEMSRTLTDLSKGTTYYWKVVLDDGSGRVESEIRSFITNI